MTRTPLITHYLPYEIVGGSRFQFSQAYYGKICSCGLVPIGFVFLAVNIVWVNSRLTFAEHMPSSYMLTYDAIVFDIVHVLRLFLHFSSVEALHVVCSLGPQNCLKVWPSLQFSTYTDIWWRSVTTRSDLTQVGPHSGCNPSTGMFLVDFPVLIGYPLFSFCCSMFSIAFGF